MGGTPDNSHKMSGNTVVHHLIQCGMPFNDKRYAF